jgi:hypothetical protein
MYYVALLCFALLCSGVVWCGIASLPLPLPLQRPSHAMEPAPISSKLAQKASFYTSIYYWRWFVALLLGTTYFNESIHLFCWLQVSCTGCLWRHLFGRAQVERNNVEQSVGRARCVPAHIIYLRDVLYVCGWGSTLFFSRRILGGTRTHCFCLFETQSNKQWEWVVEWTPCLHGVGGLEWSDVFNDAGAVIQLTIQYLT